MSSGSTPVVVQGLQPLRRPEAVCSRSNLQAAFVGRVTWKHFPLVTPHICQAVYSLPPEKIHNPAVKEHLLLQRWQDLPQGLASRQDASAVRCSLAASLVLGPSFC